MICQIVRRLTLTVTLALVGAAALAGGAGVAAAPGNDDFPGVTIGSLPFEQATDTTDATLEEDEPSPDCASPLENTVWWHHTAQASGTYVATLATNGDWAPNLGVWADSTFPGGGLAQQACGSTFFFPGEPSEDTLRVTFAAEAGRTYYFQVGGFGSFFGEPVEGAVNFALGRVEPPSNDNIADAVTIGQVPFQHSVDITGAATEPGEPEPPCMFLDEYPFEVMFGATVWYRYVPAESGQVVFGLGGDDSYASGVLWKGQPGALEEVMCGSFFSAELEAGEAYYLQVGEVWGPEFPLIGGIVSVTARELVVPECPALSFTFPEPDDDAVVTGPIPFSVDRPVSVAEVTAIHAGSNSEVACLAVEFARDIPAPSPSSYLYMDIMLDSDKDPRTGFPIEPDPDPQLTCGLMGPAGVDVEAFFAVDPRNRVAPLFTYDDFFPFGVSESPYAVTTVSGDSLTIAFPLDALGGDGAFDLVAVSIGDNGIDCLPDSGFFSVAEPVRPRFGDTNCDNGLNAGDSTAILRHVAGSAPRTGSGCPQVGLPLPSTYAGSDEVYLAGDVDCDDLVTAFDALVVLLDEAGVDGDTPGGCPGIGAMPDA